MTTPRRGLGYLPESESVAPKRALVDGLENRVDTELVAGGAISTTRRVNRPKLLGGLVALALCGGIVSTALAATSSTPVAAPSVQATQTLAADGFSRPLSRDFNRTPIADDEVPSSSSPTPSAATPAPTASDSSTTPEAPASSTTPTPTPAAQVAMYATTVVNVRTAASSSADIVTTLSQGAAVTAIGDPADGWQQVTTKSGNGFVSSQYLTTTKPTATPTTARTSSAKVGISSSYPACSVSSSIESGITAGAIRVYRAVCANFPSVPSYGGYRNDGEHSSGKAIDVMISSPAQGRAIADWARANASALGISEVIHAQQIWTVQRSSEGWRWMADRGSATANHYDHVHILVF